MSTPATPPSLAVLLGLDADTSERDVAAVVYDTLGCCLIAAESVAAVLAAVTAMEERLLRRVSARLDISINRRLATERAAYKRTKASA